ncbi:hypothetical protein [Planctomonas psychrotolerans]|uniref:hypothetical protein n=1 Tax=Planctomonas psychrotolerans TaxID=2528712 RepID=UPI00123A2F5B|nr:hypothetical protein [Planctomonas psychrotolerans]
MDAAAPERRTIRLFPDHGRTWPLWENTTPTWDVGYTTTPETYGLSPDLTAALADWNAFWVTHCDPFDGWDTREHRDRWRQRGEHLAEQLGREVALFADVSYEP